MTESLPSNASDPPDAPQPIAPAPQPEHNFFRSSSLLSVFLRVCAYLLLAYGIAIALEFSLRFFVHGPVSPFRPRFLMVGEAIQFASAFVAAGILSLLEKRSFGDYGLPARGAFGKRFWQGALLGMAEISAVIGAIAAFGAYHFGAIAIHGAALGRWLAFWAVFFLLVGLYEEFNFRGYVLFTAAQGIGFWPAAILLSVVFGLVHAGNSGEDWVGVAGVILTGLLWAFTLRRTGNLWFAVGMHASFDFGETFVYSVPDSGYVFPGHLSNAVLTGPAWLTGGTVGPEGSVFDFVMLTLFFFVINWWFPAKRDASTAAESAHIPL